MSPNYPIEKLSLYFSKTRVLFFFLQGTCPIVLYKSKPRINQIRNLKSFISPALQVERLGVILVPHINFRENTKSAKPAVDTHGHHRTETSIESIQGRA